MRCGSAASPPSNADFIKVELAVDFRKQEDENKLVELIEKATDVRIVEVNNANKTITLELAKSSSVGVADIQNEIENSIGLTTVIKGIGSVLSAVSELRPSDNKGSDEIFGVIRFSQLLNQKCYVDGLIDGFQVNQLHKRKFSAGIHEYGDLSGANYENLGQSIIELKSDITFPQSPTNANHNTKAVTLKTEIDNCNLASLIGRAVAIKEDLDQMPSKVVTAGIISRASTISENTKQICTCSGKTIWQERLDKVNK